jgi:hypothetical protein
MKKTMIFAVLIAGVYLASCTQNDVSPTATTTTAASSARTAATDPTAKGGPKDTIAVKDLPAAITAYIKATYPTAVIEHAGKTPTGGYVVIIDIANLDKGLLFDATGKFVSESAKGDCGPKGANAPKGPKPGGAEAPKDTTKHDGPKQGGKPPKGGKG